MPDALHSILRLFQCNKKERTAVLSGLDAVGKTTLLYKLKLGMVVQTVIPTIGLNVETIRCPSKLSRSKLTLTCWDVGGCNHPHINYLHRSFVKAAEVVLWLVDSTDRERIGESAEVLEDLCRDKSTPDREDRGIAPNVPILILANKQDLPNALKPSEVAPYFRFVSKGRLSHVVPTSSFAPPPESGLSEAFDWIKSAVDIVYSESHQKDSVPFPTSSTSPAPGSTSDLHSKFESYLSRAASDSPKGEFLNQFETYNLPSWDHYTHIRVAYTILTEHGRQRGNDMIFDGIREYINNSKQTTGRAFHITMTYFWIQMVHFGIRSIPPHPDDTSEDYSDEKTLFPGSRSPSIMSENTLTETEKGNPKTANKDFCRFLVLSPYVVNSNLWADYYSKEVMMSPMAKESMVLPDKKSLPNLVGRDAVRERS